jgi:hypothetical protein
MEEGLLYDTSTYYDSFIRFISPTRIMTFIMTLHYLSWCKVHRIIMFVLSMGLIKLTNSVLF